MAPSLAQITYRVPRLDGQVNWDNAILLIEGDFVIFRGSLNPTGKIVVIKCHRFLSSDYEGMEVHSSFIFAVLGSHVYAAYSPRDHHLVTALSRKHHPTRWGCEL